MGRACSAWINCDHSGIERPHAEGRIHLSPSSPAVSTAQPPALTAGLLEQSLLGALARLKQWQRQQQRQ